MNDETLAALERAAELCDDEAGRWGETVHNHLVVMCRKDAALIRAHIETLRAGGERAQIVAWLRKEAIMSTDTVRRRMNKALDQIAAGAHKQTN